jgi:hypothetical protein
MPEDTANIGQKAHVAHAIRFIQHEHFDAGQIYIEVVNVIEQPTGTGNDYFDSAPQRSDLAGFAHAAVNGDAAHPALSSQTLNSKVGLFGELACRRKNQCPHMSSRVPGQSLQYGQDEGGRLAGAGLSQTHYITPLEHDWNCLALDRCWGGIANRLDGGGYLRIERKLFEIQKVLLDSIEPSRTLSPMTFGELICGRRTNTMFAQPL